MYVSHCIGKIRCRFRIKTIGSYCIAYFVLYLMMYLHVCWPWEFWALVSLGNNLWTDFWKETVLVIICYWAVAPPFEEIRTPYTSGWEICIQKSRNACQRKEIEKHDTFQKHLYHWYHQTIQQNKMLFANNVRFPFTLHECLLWSFASCVVWHICIHCMHCFHVFVYS